MSEPVDLGPMQLRTVDAPRWYLCNGDRSDPSAPPFLAATTAGLILPLFSSEATARAFVGTRAGLQPVELGTPAELLNLLRFFEARGVPYVGIDLADPDRPSDGRNCALLSVFAAGVAAG